MSKSKKQETIQEKIERLNAQASAIYKTAKALEDAEQQKLGVGGMEYLGKIGAIYSIESHADTGLGGHFIASVDKLNKAQTKFGMEPSYGANFNINGFRFGFGTIRNNTWNTNINFPIGAFQNNLIKLKEIGKKYGIKFLSSRITENCAQLMEKLNKNSKLVEIMNDSTE